LSKITMKFNGKSVITNLAQPAGIIIIAALARLIPHPANFAPISAMALFGGVYLGKKQALILPLAAMFISDLFIGFDSFPMRVSVYGSFILAVLIGMRLKRHKNPKYIASASLCSSILFFLITNFAVWAFTNIYPKNVAGVIESYTYAVPFFRNTILGDLFYSGAFFGGYELLRSLLRNKDLALEPKS
jgi:hypothetical protein